jgi:DMSO/TMAO reductase YedYZ molybdopterin-dependent catalytic subunit
VYGLASGALATIIAFIGTRMLSLPYPPEAIFQALVAPVPGSIESIIVEMFREYAKYATFTLAVILYVLSYGFVAVLVGYVFHFDARNSGRQMAVLAAIIPTVIGLTSEVFLSPTASVLSSLAGWLIAAVFISAVNLSYAVLLVYQAARVSAAAVVEPAVRELAVPSYSSRRGFLKKIALVVAALVVTGVAARIGMSLFSGQPVIRSNESIPTNPTPVAVQPSDLPAVFRDVRIKDLVDSEVTDNRVFYRVDINLTPPQLDFDKWALKIWGKVNKPLTLDRDSLMKLPATNQYATLECVSNTINPPGGLISNAKWTGVSLADFLSEAAVSPDAKYVVFHCADGYSVGVPLDRAMSPGAMLAYKMNDELLPNEHGFPLRAIVPGIYGMMNAKWIQEIEVVDYVYLGYWQTRGWSNDAKVKTTSIIYYPGDGSDLSGPTPIAGVAFAGDRGISKVEVSVDGGNTWNEAVLKKPTSPYSWVLWAYDWTPAGKGTYTIVVRAYDGAGNVQDPTVRSPFPDGASGYHKVQLTAS